jgi:hypothetical protein
VGQDYPAWRKRRVGLQKRQHEILLLGRRRRPQVFHYFKSVSVITILIYLQGSQERDVDAVVERDSQRGPAAKHFCQGPTFL